VVNPKELHRKLMRTMKTLARCVAVKDCCREQTALCPNCYILPKRHSWLGRNVKELLLAALTCVLAFTAAAAGNPFVGTWEMNMMKSKLDAAAPKFQNRTIVYTAESSGLKAVVTTDGKAQTDVTYDGQQHAVTPASGLYTHETATAKDRTLETEFKKDGKVVGSRKNSLSADGRTMTVVLDLRQANGNMVHSVAVYDKR